MTIKARNSSMTQSPKDFTIEYWDVDHWEVAHTVTGETAWSSSEVRTFNGWSLSGGAPARQPVVFICT